jgi:hypothetical protein
MTTLIIKLMKKHSVDFTKPFFLLTDTSAYDVGAILSQEGGITDQNTTQKPRLHPVAYYSVTFTETK